MKEKWTCLINRRNNDGSRWEPKIGSRICTVHFPEGGPTSVSPLPTKFLGYTPTTSKTALPRPQSVKRKQYKQQEQNEKCRKTDHVKTTVTEPVGEAALTLPHLPHENSQPEGSCVRVKYDVEAIAASTFPSPVKQNKKNCKSNIFSHNHQSYTTERLKQLELISKPLHKRILTSDNSVHFYTNLTNLETFTVLCHYMKKIKNSPSNTSSKNKQTTLSKYWGLKKCTVAKKLTKQVICLEDRILLTLMKLRLDLLLKDLADR